MPKQTPTMAEMPCDIDYMKDIAEFGAKVRAYREKRKMSLDDLANRINSDKSALSRIENGERIPRLDNVLRIADALNLTPAKLLPDRFLDNSNADVLPQIYKRLMRQSVEQRRTSIQYICAMLDGLAFSEGE